MIEKTYDAALRAQNTSARHESGGEHNNRQLKNLYHLSLRARGSLSIEAALLLPVFLLFHLFLLGFFQIMLFQIDVQESLQRQALHFAEAAAYTEESGKWVDVLIIPFFLADFPSERREQMPISSGLFNLVPIPIVEDDYLTVTVAYGVDFPAPAGTELAVHAVRQRQFTGISLKKQGEEPEEEEQTVYRTANGSVYHLSPTCSHIRLSVKTVTWREVKELRNKSGGRYYGCEYCTLGGSPDPAYVTDYGDRYHSARDCPAIRRDVIAVKLSEVGDMRVCSRCGAQTGGAA